MANAHDKTVTLIVNTVGKPWDQKKITYKEAVILAFGSYSDDPKITYTVEYFRGSKEQHEGTLTKDQDVTVKDQMVFNVTETNRS